MAAATSSPSFELRGWLGHNGLSFTVDAATRDHQGAAVVSGTLEVRYRTYRERDGVPHVQTMLLPNFTIAIESLRQAARTLGDWQALPWEAFKVAPVPNRLLLEPSLLVLIGDRKDAVHEVNPMATVKLEERMSHSHVEVAFRLDQSCLREWGEGMASVVAHIDALGGIAGPSRKA